MAGNVIDENGIRVVGDREDLLEDFVEAFVQEPLEGFRLDFDKIRKLGSATDFREIDAVVEAGFVVLIRVYELFICLSHCLLLLFWLRV